MMRRLLSLLALAASVSCVSAEPFIPTIETTNFASSLGVDLAASTKTPSGMYYRNIIVGGGAQVPDTGHTSVSVTYAGYFRNGAMFDSGNDLFTTNNGDRIAGYNEGILGMKVGGSRQLIIPPALAYGSQGYGSIGPNQILVFTVTLTAIH